MTQKLNLKKSYPLLYFRAQLALRLESERREKLNKPMNEDEYRFAVEENFTDQLEAHQ